MLSRWKFFIGDFNDEPEYQSSPLFHNNKLLKEQRTTRNLIADLEVSSTSESEPLLLSDNDSIYPIDDGLEAAGGGDTPSLEASSLSRDGFRKKRKVIDDSHPHDRVPHIISITGPSNVSSQPSHFMETIAP